jgi:hypothetical protein
MLVNKKPLDSGTYYDLLYYYSGLYMVYNGLCNFSSFGEVCIYRELLSAIYHKMVGNLKEVEKI